MKNPKQKAKPVKAWAHVCVETNRITFVWGPGVSKLTANNILYTGERLARVEIKEI